MDRNTKNIRDYKNTVDSTSIAEAKSHFSEYIPKVVYAKKRYSITRRNKPVAGLIPIEELNRLKSEKDFLLQNIAV